ncbi:hypothetical protein SK355_09460 [Candidatus Fukatsuia symbiotica]|uniref:hypothetical protein n=1 Tax=Candidatus Fukatsuia TaxID=1927833 RepID=UPI002B246CFA|nr:hypothetical protein [Candidatus Fukatsuia symbiotica]MEA9445445.1 hypothetical protein [Candidatus Fukatsuia symbiotica]
MKPARPPLFTWIKAVLLMRCPASTAIELKVSGVTVNMIGTLKRVPMSSALSLTEN